ncbi:single-stranded-DNA-specific exonuclease RecJ [Sulfurihydrogenibium subterraneum]|uniref:single-stranded-DNA-specific exonuclease RecJ n=1 Tax=Sulfurihydrogenibium subterraneum TaxID=171121 RepID=UPI0004908CF0|nr:single-stranded-DNA-specific exonuclease RecJ [Sulfurihydrogenibium subterraneum]
MDIGLSGYQWVLLSQTNPAPEELKDRFGEVFAQVLYNRKDLFDKDFSEDYIVPQLKNLINPSYFYSLEEVAIKLVDSIKKQKRIVIYGDYDADGITSTALLVNFFRDIKVPVKYYIPSRFTEGYGLNKEAIKSISDTADVLIVVDSGTNAIEELLYAKSLGLEVFVLDHHEPSDFWIDKNPLTFDSSIHIINPKFYDDEKINLMFKHLATVGIAFYLISLIRRFLNIEDIKLRNYLDIVAIGTIADIVPMSFINRVMVKTGLEEINKKNRIGITKLREVASIQRDVNTQDIAFMIAPRINAAGRLADARKSVKLLTTKDEISATFLANELENLNKKRQKITDNVLKEAELEISKYPLESAIVLGRENWHSGVVGIVAGKLVEKYKIPTVILSIENGKAVGSARSVSKVNIYKALDKCKHLFEKFGGHSAAAGLTINSDKIQEFRYALNQTVKEVAEEKPWAVKEIDMEVPLSYWDKGKVLQLYQLAPFGEKNPYPKFIDRNLRVDFFSVYGKNLVILDLRDKNKKVFTVKCWKGQDIVNQIYVGSIIDIVYTPEISNYKGIESIEFTIDDIKIVK